MKSSNCSATLVGLRNKGVTMTIRIEHFEMLQILLLVVSISAIVTSKLRLPYSVGLVLVGGILAIFPVIANITMTKDLIYKVLLPPLIFEAALFLPQKALRREFPLIITLATVGVILAAMVVTLGLHWLLAWPWISAAIFGALISATDPISVIAIFKESHVNERLRLLVEGESLFNDGTAAVMFTILVSLAGGASLSCSAVLINLIFMIVGSLVCGMLVTFLILFMIGKTNDPLVEITFTTVAAYGSFSLAEYFHLSGVLATLTAGLIMGNKTAHNVITEKGRIAVTAFWEYLAFLSNSFVFLLIGIREVQQPFQPFWMTSIIAIIVLLVARIVSIYPLGFVFSAGRLRMTMKYQHILFWGGLRGALALALALGLPDTVPYKEEITSIAFIVVAFSIVVQGITIKPLLYYLGELKTKPIK
jgi:CPA1 family monovalent cation:H+ antiporter